MHSVPAPHVNTSGEVQWELIVGDDTDVTVRLDSFPKGFDTNDAHGRLIQTVPAVECCRRPGLSADIWRVDLADGGVRDVTCDVEPLPVGCR